MEFEKYLNKIKNIQENLINFLDDEEISEENSKNLNQILEDLQKKENLHEQRLFLRLVSKISNNHHRNLNFFEKIEKILQYFKDTIKKYPNSEIFSIFKKNKRILLFLIEEKILILDENIVKKLTTDKYLTAKYPQYFSPEIKIFINEKWFPKNKLIEDLTIELPNDFYELRKNGKNDSFICKLIQNDSVIDFITYLNRYNISRNAIIKPSIYETNYFLIKKQNKTNENQTGITLIEYAAFFGSIQIFNYLKNEGAELTQSLWYYSIHSQNAELIHILEEQNIIPKILIDKGFPWGKFHMTSYIKCLKESIKCNHNNIANYILNKYLHNEDEKSYDVFIQSLKNCNFLFIQNEYINESSFNYLCKYDYYSLVLDLITNKNININKRVIQNYIIE